MPKKKSQVLDCKDITDIIVDEFMTGEISYRQAIKKLAVLREDAERMLHPTEYDICEKYIEDARHEIELAREERVRAAREKKGQEKGQEKEELPF